MDAPGKNPSRKDRNIYRIDLHIHFLARLDGFSTWKPLTRSARTGVPLSAPHGRIISLGLFTLSFFLCFPLFTKQLMDIST